ncbi:hypothetical protein Dimus_024373 [Dionaea muscipula]
MRETQRRVVAPSSFWRLAVDSRKARFCSGNGSSGPLVSLFVDNLPEYMKARNLFMLLNKFVKVVDVFIPWKRRVVSNSRFGFVKVKGYSAADNLIKRVNGLWVMDQLLVVKEAFGVAQSVAKGRVSLGHRNHNQQTPADSPKPERGYVAQRFWERRSYVDVLKGMVNGGSRPPSLDVDIKEDRTSWLYCSLLGALAEDKDELAFKEEEARETALTGEVALRSWFQWLRSWSNKGQPGVLRDAWLKCTRLPHQVWSQTNLAQIRTLWGDVIAVEHVIKMMAMAFGWVKVCTSALQPISQDVKFIYNGGSSWVHVSEESVFNPEQWVIGSSRGLQNYTMNGGTGRWQHGVANAGMTSQRSFVYESRLSVGPTGIAGISKGDDILAAGIGPKGRETFGGKEADVGDVGDDTNTILNSNMPIKGSHAIVPFAPSQILAPDQCHLVVDLGRAFGPIPVIKNSHVTTLPWEGHVVLDAMALGQGTQEPIEVGSLVESLCVICGNHRGRGGGFKKKNQRVLVRAAVAAMAGDQTSQLMQEHQELLHETRSAWDLGKNLGLQASTSDAEVIQRIFEMKTELLSNLLDQLRTSGVQSLHDYHDKVLWAAESHGIFTVHSMYNHFSSNVGLEDPCLSVIWSSIAPPRAKFFCWLAWQRRRMKMLIIYFCIVIVCGYCGPDVYTGGALMGSFPARAAGTGKVQGPLVCHSKLGHLVTKVGRSYSINYIVWHLKDLLDGGSKGHSFDWMLFFGQNFHGLSCGLCIFDFRAVSDLLLSFGSDRFFLFLKAVKFMPCEFVHNLGRGVFDLVSGLFGLGLILPSFWQIR